MNPLKMMFILHLLLYRDELVNPESGLCCIIDYADCFSDRPDSSDTNVSLFTGRRHDHSNLKSCEKRKNDEKRIPGRDCGCHEPAAQ